MRRQAEEALLERDQLRATEVGGSVWFLVASINGFDLSSSPTAIQSNPKLQLQARRELSRLRAQQQQHQHHQEQQQQQQQQQQQAPTDQSLLAVVESKAQLLARYERREAELRQLAAEAAAAKAEAARCQREQRSSAALYSELCAVVQGEGAGAGKTDEAEGLRRAVGRLEREKARAEGRVARALQELKRLREEGLGKEEGYREGRRRLEGRVRGLEGEVAALREREGKLERRLRRALKEAEEARAKVEEGEGRWQGKVDALRAGQRQEVGHWVSFFGVCVYVHD